MNRSDIFAIKAMLFVIMLAAIGILVHMLDIMLDIMPFIGFAWVWIGWAFSTTDGLMLAGLPLAMLTLILLVIINGISKS